MSENETKVKMEKPSKTGQSINKFLEDKNKAPLLLAWNNNGNVMCFAGTFSLEQLCLLKEVVNRKIDSMLNQAIHMGVEIDAIKEDPKTNNRRF